MKAPPARPTHVYLGAVSVAGGLVYLVALVRGVAGLYAYPSIFWVISGVLLVAELFPILAPRPKREVDEMTVSSAFGFAMVIAFGIAPAVIVQCTASIVSDLRQRKPWWKVVFKVASYALALSAAGRLYVAFGGGPHVTTATLLPTLVAGLAYMVLNVSIVSVGAGLAGGESLPRYVWGDILWDAHTIPVLLALSPVIVVAADRSPWLVLFTAAPAAAVHWGTKLAAENSRLVERLQGSLDEMTELNRMKDEFVGVVSHELRTPLTSIQGYIKTLLQLSPELDEGQRTSFLQAADRQSERLRRLIEQLLVVARLESHTEPLVISRVSLARLVAMVADELGPRAHGRVFDVRIPQELSDLETDEGKLHQILSNLVENALKYSPPDTRVGIIAAPGEQGVVVTIRDEGPGVPPESRERIFERFYQVDQSVTRRVGGTGLGLYICRRMADALGGRLWLARSDDEGSEFCLFIPERPPTPETAEAASAPGLDQSITASV